MAAPIRRARAVFPPVALAAVALLAAGCGNDEGVRSYRVPKSADAAPTARNTPDFRMLGAMYPADNPEWFLKFSGPADQITGHEAAFDQIASSIKLIPGGKPEFVLPTGWTRGGPRGGGIVAETARTPDGSLEVTVTQAKGGVEGNLKRWVEQIGLTPSPDARAKYTRPIDAAGVKGLRVDLRGTKNPATSRGPMMGGR